VASELGVWSGLACETGARSCSVRSEAGVCCRWARSGVSVADDDNSAAGMTSGVGVGFPSGVCVCAGVADDVSGFSIAECTLTTTGLGDSVGDGVTVAR